MAQLIIESFPGLSYSNLAASGMITLGRGFIGNVILVGGSANATLTLYDGRDDKGTSILTLASIAGHSSFADLGLKVPFRTGLYAVLAGAGVQCFISYLQTE